jgi:EmrB/QacA subfamily drug resistance transporter
MTQVSLEDVAAGEFHRPRDRKSWWTLFALTLSSFLLLLGDTSLNVVLPDVGRQFGLSLSGLEWLVNGYTLALAVLLLPAGKLADRLGARRVFLAGVLLFSAASLAAGLAPETVALFGSRVAQGAGAALATPAALALITETFPAEKRGLPLGLWTAAATTALAIGPMVGAGLGAVGGWRAVLLVNVPAGVVVLAIAAHVLPHSAGRADGRFDFAGLASSALGLGALLYALTNGGTWGWASVRLELTVAVALAALALFLIVELRARRPMLDLALFRRRGFAGANGVGLLLTAVMCSVFFFLSLYLQLGLGYSPLITGLLFLPMTLPVALVAPLAGLIADRRGAQLPLVAGSLAVAIGLTTLAASTARPTLPLLITALVLIGTGMGLATTPLTAAAVADLPAADSGMGAAVINTFRTVGLALGIALMGAIVGAGSGGALAASVPVGLGVNAGLALVAGAVAALTLRRNGPLPS